MKINRYEENPLIAPKDVEPYHEGFEVIGAFNAGVAVHEGETLLLLRVAERPLPREEGTVGAPMIDPNSGKVVVKALRLDDPRYDFSDPRTIREHGSEGALAYLTSLSYIRIARSRDGRHFTVDDRPFIYPSGTLETFGIEDPRVTRIGDTYYIYFSAVSPAGIGESLVSTKDFVHTQHHGMIFGPDNKDVIIFPEKVGGKYYALHRPTTPSTGRPEIWLAESDNLLYWGNHKHLLGLRPDYWDSGRIGGGAVPIRTEQGWLALYHGATREHRYCMGAVLLDADDPSRVLARSARPILEPEAPYETDGFFGGVVFACGAAVDGDTVRLYYGAADTSTACAELSLSEIMEGLEPV